MAYPVHQRSPASLRAQLVGIDSFGAYFKAAIAGLSWGEAVRVDTSPVATPIALISF